MPSALLTIRRYGHAIARMTSLYVILPHDRGPHRVVYQLHGLSDDESAWQRKTTIEEVATANNLMVVMPNGDRSWYCNGQVDDERWEDHLLETIAYVDANLPTIPIRAARGIGGLSMGGYGAVKMGLKHPQLFASVVSHSGAVDLHNWLAEARKDHLAMIFNGKVPPSDDAFALAKRLRRSRQPKPALHLDCGHDDFLIDYNRAFHAHLTTIGLAHTYTEHPGVHDWTYWQAHLAEGLAFHAQHLRRGKRPRRSVGR